MISVVLWIVGGGVFLVFLIYVIHKREERQRRLTEEALAHMAARPVLDANAFGQTYFESSEVAVAIRLRSILQNHFSFDLGTLHPDDRLVADLHMDDLDSMAAAEFLMEVEQEFKIKIPNGAARKMRTLRDVVTFVSEQLRLKKAPPA
jgi:acyl carrier protein